MYYQEDREQLSIEEFFQPFGGRLRKDNRWVKLAGIMPWEYIEKVYMKNMSEETGRPAITSRIAFGALFINAFCHLTDEGTVQELQENSYMQYFVGLHEFHAEPLFDPSMMVHFRKRFPVEEVAKINEYVCTGKWPEEPRNVDRNDDTDHEDEPPAPLCGDGESGAKPSKQKGKVNRNTSKKKKERRKKNRGKLLLDATVAPADIKYPTDIDLLNKSREHLEAAIDKLWLYVDHSRHKLPYSAKKARKSYLKLAKSKKWTQRKCHTVIGEQLRYVELASNQLQKYESMVSDYETFYPRWLRDRLAVIPTVYRQQKEMYDNHTHTCENRIVSLEQPHVRPIQRGKRPNPTEFGQKLHLSVVDGYTFLEQTSWSNFNEGNDLEAAVEDYKRKFGCYPSAVLADRIYQTRSNKLFCSQRGIRLSGLPLGRRKASETDAKIKRQIYNDSCDRNAIEGRNGTSKRRFGLDRIFSKLDETAKTEAALILLAMNASLRLARWLAHFLRPFLLPFHFLCFSADPTYSGNQFLEQFMLDWAARADWAVSAEANNPPVVSVTSKDMTAAAGEVVSLNGSATDPNGDHLYVKWWVYEAGGKYSGTANNLRVWNENKLTTKFTVPKDAKPGDYFNLILEVTDDAGEYSSFTRYAQVIVTVPGTPEEPGKENQPTTPDADPQPTTPDVNPQPKTYTVKSGDNLSKIAKKYLGSALKWKDIYKANKSIIKNPNLIFPGQVLVIP